MTEKKTDIMKKVFEKRKALRDFRFQLAGSKTRDVKEARKIKKETARLLTELNMNKAETK